MLDVRYSPSAVESNVSPRHILNRFVSPIVLSNAADRDTKPVVEVAVLHQDIRRVGFLGDGVIAVVDRPSTEGDVVSIDRVRTIRVDDGRPVVRRAVDVDVLQQDAVRIDDGHGPHLRLQEAYVLDHGIVDPREGDLMRAARVVGRAVVEVVPHLAVAIERPVVEAVDTEIAAAEQPRR